MVGKKEPWQEKRPEPPYRENMCGEAAIENKFYFVYCQARAIAKRISVFGLSGTYHDAKNITLVIYIEGGKVHDA